MKLYNIKSNGGLTKCNLIWWVFNICFWRTLVSQLWTWDVYLQVMCASVTLLHSEHPGAGLLGCSLFSYLQEVRDTRETYFRIIKQQSHKGSNFLCTQPKHHSDTSCLDSEKKNHPNTLVLINNWLLKQMVALSQKIESSEPNWVCGTNEN